MLHYMMIALAAMLAAPAMAQQEESAEQPEAEQSTESSDQEESEDEAEEESEEDSESEGDQESDKEGDQESKQEGDQEQDDDQSSEEEADKGEGEPDEWSSKASVVLEGLNNPSGLAIQPETGTVFVSDSGNYQVVKLVDGEAKPVITDFPQDVYGKGPEVNIGPLGLLFLDKNTLVVGGGGLPDGEELLRVYELPEGDEPVKADAMKTSFRLEETDEIKGEGNFYDLIATPAGIYVTCNGDDTKGWVSKATLEGGEVTGYERYLATKEATGVDAPVGIAVSPEGYLVVGQMGEMNLPNDSLITFYDENSKEMLLNLETDLYDIAAVAYSPRKQLYVLDYAWMTPSEGGLFQVIEDKESDNGIRTVKIMSLDKPTAMAFDGDGALYITVIGEAEDANSKGKLLKIDASFGL